LLTAKCPLCGFLHPVALTLPSALKSIQSLAYCKVFVVWVLTSSCLNFTWCAQKHS
jgi:hypothetical protein